jgi:hypothetical protein
MSSVSANRSDELSFELAACLRAQSVNPNGVRRRPQNVCRVLKGSLRHRFGPEEGLQPSGEVRDKIVGRFSIEFVFVSPEPRDHRRIMRQSRACRRERFLPSREHQPRKPPGREV